MAIFEPVWAEDGSVRVPSAAEIEAGFRCGAADPDVFNWLIQSLMSAVNGLDTGGMVPLTRAIATTEGIRGGGALSADRTLRLDINGLETRTTIANGNYVVIYADGQHYKITRANFVAGLGGDAGSIAGAENVGEGTGEIFAGLDTDTIQLRTLVQGAGLSITTAANEVTIAFADLPTEDTIE